MRHSVLCFKQGCNTFHETVPCTYHTMSSRFANTKPMTAKWKSCFGPWVFGGEESKHCGTPRSIPDLVGLALTEFFDGPASKLRSETRRANMSWRSTGTELGPNSGGWSKVGAKRWLIWKYGNVKSQKGHVSLKKFCGEGQFVPRMQETTRTRS